MRKIISKRSFMTQIICLVLFGVIASANVLGQTNWNGNWKYVSEWSPATLSIKSVSKSKIKFSIEAFSGANEGSIDGVATISGNKARFVKKDSVTKEVCRLDFSHKGKSISVNAEGCQGYAGLGVGFDGEYFKNPKKVESNFVTMEVFPNKEVDGKFRALVGKDYKSFTQTFHLYGEDEDKDNFGAKVFSGCVRGICPYMAAIIMFDKDSNFWAAYIDANDGKTSTVSYYSNVAQWTDKMPKTITEWVDDKRSSNENLKIIYKNK